MHTENTKNQRNSRLYNVTQRFNEFFQMHIENTHWKFARPEEFKAHYDFSNFYTNLGSYISSLFRKVQFQGFIMWNTQHKIRQVFTAN